MRACGCAYVGACMRACVRECVRWREKGGYCSTLKINWYPAICSPTIVMRHIFVTVILKRVVFYHKLLALCLLTSIASHSLVVPATEMCLCVSCIG